MTHVARRGVACAALLAAAAPVLAGVQAPARGAGSEKVDPWLGTWRLTSVTVAPWVTTDRRSASTSTLSSRVVQLQRTAVRGPAPFACADPRYTRTTVPPDGLFQGNLPKPSETSARALGFSVGAVRGVRVQCGGGVFELHAPDDRHLMIAIDNTLWTLDRSPGALAAVSAPEGVVQALLEQHFAGAMTLDSASVRGAARFLSRGLTTQLIQYLRRPTPDNEAPALNGDPFTDSQEYPTRFSVSTAIVSANRATVPVQMADGYATRSLRYRLQSTTAGWRVYDIVYDGTMTLTSLLTLPPTPDVTAPAWPSWADAAWRTESSARQLALDTTLTPNTMVADLDGDGRLDVARTVRHRRTGARGVLVLHAGSRAAQQCGAGVTFGNGGDNYDWMDHWELVPNSRGRGVALLVSKTEAASARIEFHAGRYHWKQRGD